MVVRGAVLAACLIVGVGCGGDEPPAERSAPDSIDADELALPPSAVAPRASLPGRTPDTLRPEGREALPPEPGDDRSRRLSPEELDVDVIVDAYRRYYIEEYYEAGSAVRGDVDPELVVHAKRRVALDLGYVDVGAWDALTRDMLSGQRSRLNTELANVNRALAAQLHGAESP